MKKSKYDNYKKNSDKTRKKIQQVKKTNDFDKIQAKL